MFSNFLFIFKNKAIIAAKQGSTNKALENVEHILRMKEHSKNKFIGTVFPLTVIFLIKIIKKKRTILSFILKKD